MKKCFISAVCALSLVAGSSIYAADATLKSCTIDNTNKGCSVSVSTGKDTIQVIFERFPVDKDTDALSCHFINDNLNIGVITGVDGDLSLASHIDQADEGQLTVKLVKKVDKSVSGSLSFDVSSINPLDDHAITFRDCKVLK